MGLIEDAAGDVPSDNTRVAAPTIQEAKAIRVLDASERVFGFGTIRKIEL